MTTPKTWTGDELDLAARSALAHFVTKRLAEGSIPYQEAFRQAKPRVQALFRATNNLRHLDDAVLVNAPELLEAARYLGGPPLSQDDLDTLCGTNVCNRRSLSKQPAARAVKAVQAFLDPFRCPWLRSDAKPTGAMVKSAINWTASLWAVEKCRTERRGAESAHQAKVVAQLLVECRLSEAKGLRRIQSLDELDRGRFTSEIILGDAKADFAVRLRDGRLLAIECKASNSALNSVKRLNRETAGKAERWHNLYGQQILTMAVLSGVFKVSNLMDAQSAGVFIAWQHDLRPLRDFVVGARKR